MTVKTFVDSNIFLYAFDVKAGWKHEICNQKLVELWDTGGGVLSTQVMQEFYNNVTRKISQPLSYTAARAELKLYEAWEVIQVDPALIRTASMIQENRRLSFWDSLIVTAAQEANADILLSEDLNHGQVIGNVRIHNPLLNQVQEESASYSAE